MCDGGVRRGGEQRFVHLSVVVGRECDEAAQRVVCRERHLHGFVAARGLRERGEDVAVERTLVAE